MSTADSLEFFQRHADVVRSVRSHCFASLAFQIWDTILTFEDEVDYIWPIPWSYKMKWWYLYLRYVTLAAHIAYSLAICYLTSGEASETSCRAWFLSAIVVAMFSRMQVELMFVIRVYAFFNQRRWVLLLLCMLYAVDPTIKLVVTVLVVPQLGFDEACVIVPFSGKDLSYAGLAPIAQTILVGMMLTKSFLAIRAGWGRRPLVSLLVCEGFTSYIVFVSLVTSAAVLSLHGGTQIFSLIIWAPAILSVCGCRLTINMQQLARKIDLERQSRPASNLALTSQIEMTGFTIDSIR